jgi:hypothetical protein
MDFSLTEDADLARCRASDRCHAGGDHRAGGLRGGRKVRELKWLRLSGRFDYDDGDAAAMRDALQDFFARRTRD